MSLRSAGARALLAALATLLLLAPSSPARASDQPRPADADPPAPGPASAAPEPVAVSPRVLERPPDPIIFRGNLLFNPYLYRALLDLSGPSGPIRLEPTEATAKRVRLRIGSFLRRAGYELATVAVTVEGGRLVVQLDEGELDQVVILGVGGWDGVRFHLDLDLPMGVYNKLLLDDRLSVLCPKYGMLRCTATLLEKVPAEGTTPLLQNAVEKLEEMGGAFVPHELVRAARSHELRIKLEPPPQHTSFWPSLDVGGSDGVKLGVNGYLEGRPFEGGWTEVTLRGGGGMRNHADGSGSGLAFTRALFEARSRMPAFVDGKLRPAVGLLADLTARGRSDLGVDTFYQARFEGALVADLTPRGRELELGVGFGLRDNLIFDQRLLPTPDPIIAATPTSLLRPFLLFFAHSDLSADELRHDRHHQLDLLLKLRAGGDAYSPLPGQEVAVDARWQRYTGFGWNELWFRFHGQGRIGDSLYTDEDALGSDLRGALGDTFIRSEATLLTEFRYSLVRDLLKVSVFDALTVFGRIKDRVSHDEAPQGALTVGLGVHGLVWTVLSVDLYGGMAWTTDGKFGTGVSLEVHEAYH